MLFRHLATCKKCAYESKPVGKLDCDATLKTDTLHFMSAETQYAYKSDADITANALWRWLSNICYTWGNETAIQPHTHSVKDTLYGQPE